MFVFSRVAFFAFFVRSLRVALALVMVAYLAAPVAAQQASSGAVATVSGSIVDRRDALPIAGASVALEKSGVVASTATTSSGGAYVISNVTPGVYTLVVRATGYSASSTTDVAIAPGASVHADAALEVAQTSGATNYRTIGTVSASSNATLASATTITQSVSVANLQQTGQIRVADQLGTLPAINLSTSSSPGDDVSINIRGFGSTETATLLDGRPVGPLGVLAPDSFNFADTPIFGLNSVDVTYGSGAQGLYGSDTIGGAVNLQLIGPTSGTHVGFDQQIGGFGKLSTSVDATGTVGKLGYAFAAGTIGETGSFNGGPVFQSARPALLEPGSVRPPYACANTNGNDVSTCNQDAETYGVSQDTKLGADMLKLRYAIAPSTALQVSAYSAVQEADSTGNGDNDFLPYQSRLGQILQQSSNCTVAGGGAGYTVVTNPVSNATACYTAQQWASVSSGPDGGGAGRNRSVSMRDYDARLTTVVGANDITFDTYINNYDFEKDSALSGGVDAAGLELGTPDYTRYYNTHGYLLSDDIASAKNDFGVGFSILNQLQTAQELVSVGTPNATTGESQLAFQSSYAPSLFREDSAFIRDSYQFSSQYSAFLNAWVKHSSVTNQTTFDPRFTVQVRPDSHDVVRLTYGRSDGPPAPELKSSAPVFEQDPGSSLTSVECGVNALPNSAGNPNLSAEGANDFELGYGHRFNGDSKIEANAYVTSVQNQLTGATEPLLQYGLGNVHFDNSILQNYLSHLVTQGCLPSGSPIAAAYPFLGVSTTYNIGHELARGIDIDGRYRFNRLVYVDYAYSVESSQQSGIADDVLMANPTLLNGGQQLGLPIHQGTLSIDVAPRSWEFRLDNYYVDGHNTLDRPAYWHSNAFITKSFDGGKAFVTLGGTNVFNSAVQNYGYIGSGVAPALNKFATPGTTGLADFLNGTYSAEEFGLSPPQVSLTLSARL